MNIFKFLGFFVVLLRGNAIQYYVNSETYSENPDGSIAHPFSKLEDIINKPHNDSYEVFIVDVLKLKGRIVLESTNISIGSSEAPAVLLIMESGSIILSTNVNLSLIGVAVRFQNLSSSSYPSVFTLEADSSMRILHSTIETFDSTKGILSLFIVYQGNFSSFNSSYSSIKLNSACLLLATSDITSDVSNSFVISFENCLFLNITQDSSSQFAFIFLKGYNISLLFKSNDVLELTSYKGFLQTRNTASEIILKGNRIRNASFSSSFLSFGGGKQLIFEANQCEYLNKRDYYNFTDSEGLLSITNIINIEIKKSWIINAFSDKTTVGVKIFQSSITETNLWMEFLGSPLITISECEFKHLYTVYRRNSFAGGAILISALTKVIINNCTFEDVNLNSSSNLNEKIGGPALMSLSRENEVHVTFSVFKGCHSRFLSNAVIFMGALISIKDSLFQDNFPIFDQSARKNYEERSLYFKSIMDVHFEIGGCLLLLADASYLEGCIFTGNMGYSGGAVAVNAKLETTQSNFQMIRCYLKNNLGGMFGGALGFNQNLKLLSALVINSVFEANMAYFGGALSTYYSGENCSVIVKSTTFTKNNADYGAAIDVSNKEGALYILESTFLENIAEKKILAIGGGSVIRLMGVFFSEKNSFIRNKGLHLGVIISWAGKFIDRNSLFHSNWAMLGSSSYALEHSSYYFYKTRFFNETVSKSGVLVMKENSRLFVSEVVIERSFSKDQGGIFLVSEKSSLEANNSTFIQNKANQGSILYVYENKMESERQILFSFCTFTQSSSLSSSFDVSDGKIFILNCSIKANKNIVFHLHASILFASNLIIEDLECSNDFQGCLISAKANSFIEIRSMIARKIYSSVEGAGVYAEESYILFYAVEFESLSSLTSLGLCVMSRNSEIKLLFVSFGKYFGNCIYSSESSIFIENSVFSNENLLEENAKLIFQNKSACIIEQSVNFILKDSKFYQNTQSNSGGAIEFSEESISRLNVSIILNSEFSFNSATENGGAISIFNCSLTIIESTFKNNKAKRGAALYFSAPEGSAFDLTLRSNVFSGNQAILEGGAIKITGKIINISMNTFSDNIALYGPVIASYPYRLKTFVGDEAVNDHSEILLIPDISSGNEVPIKLSFSLIDLWDQVVIVSDSETLKIEFLQTEELAIFGLKDWNRTRSNIFSPSVTYLLGKAVIPSIVIIAKPGLIYLKLQTTAIRTFSQFLSNDKVGSDKNFSNKYIKVLKIQIQACTVGEIYIDQTNTCFKCPFNTFSVTSNGNRVCRLCPRGAVCPGGRELIPLKGFWKSSENSNSIYFCKEFSDFCLGQSARNCSEGYIGPLCSSCDRSGRKKFYRSDDNLCAECLQPSLLFVRFSLFFALIAILLWLLVDSFHKQSNKLRAEGFQLGKIPIARMISIYLKILINYSQIISIIIGMDLIWPLTANSFFKVQITLGELSSYSLSLECLFIFYDLESDPVYLRCLYSVVTPAVIIFIFFIFMGAKKAFKASYKNFHFFITFLVSNVFLQPGVIKELTRLMKCEDFENEQSLLSVERQIDCNSTVHRDWLNKVIYPALVYWIVIYPGASLLFLIKNRNNINKPMIRSQFGFFINGYKPSFYFWEFIIMYRKICIILIAYLLKQPDLTKATLIIFISAISCYFTIEKRPFIKESFNDLEIKSNLCSLLVVYFGVFYLSIENELGKTVLFLAIFITNGNFLFFWISAFTTSILSIYSETIYNRFPAFFQLCVAFKKAQNLIMLQEMCFIYRIPAIFASMKIYYEEYRSRRLRIIFTEYGNDEKGIFDLDVESNTRQFTFKEKAVLKGGSRSKVKLHFQKF